MSAASFENTSAPANTRDQHSSAVTTQPRAGLPVADRDRLTRLPQVALHQLARPVHRTLKPPADQKPRPHRPHVLVEDRLPARIADLHGHLPQPPRRHPRLRPNLAATPPPD